MSDTREALTRLISEAIAVAAKTSAGINPEFDGQIVIDWRHGLPDFVAALDALALVVPCSDIVGTEYGVRWVNSVGSVVYEGPYGCLSDAEETAAEIREHRSKIAVVSRPELPGLPWSVIPLPEQGAQQ